MDYITYRISEDYLYLSVICGSFGEWGLIRTVYAFGSQFDNALGQRYQVENVAEWLIFFRKKKNIFININCLRSFNGKKKWIQKNLAQYETNCHFEP